MAADVNVEYLSLFLALYFDEGDSIWLRKNAIFPGKGDGVCKAQHSRDNHVHEEQILGDYIMTVQFFECFCCAEETRVRYG